MISLHTMGGPGVGSQSGPPADGGRQPKGTHVPAVGTLAEEGSRSGGAIVTRQSTAPPERPPIGGQNNLQRARYGARLPMCNRVKRDERGIARRYLCPFPDPADVLPDWDKHKRWTCPVCGYTFHLNEVVQRWFVA